LNDDSVGEIGLLDSLRVIRQHLVRERRLDGEGSISWLGSGDEAADVADGVSEIQAGYESGEKRRSQPGCFDYDAMKSTHFVPSASLTWMLVCGWFGSRVKAGAVAGVADEPPGTADDDGEDDEAAPMTSGTGEPSLWPEPWNGFFGLGAPALKSSFNLLATRSSTC
jgi:hypothetical protein